MPFISEKPNPREWNQRYRTVPARVARAAARHANALAEQMNAAAPAYYTGVVRFRARAHTEAGVPGHIIERQYATGRWDFVGWAEDVHLVGREYHCYGVRLA